MPHKPELIRRHTSPIPVAIALGSLHALAACTADETPTDNSEQTALASGLDALRGGHASYGFDYLRSAPEGPAVSIAVDTAGLVDACPLYSSKPPVLARYWLLRADVGATVAGEYQLANSRLEPDGAEVFVYERGRDARNQQLRAIRGTVTLDDDATELGAPLSMHIDVELEPRNTTDGTEQNVQYTLDLTAHYCPSLCSYGPTENAGRCEPD